MDVPYESKRHGHKHLSITVQEDGQIQQLDEAEAGFRLASIIAKAPPPRDHGLAGTALSATPATTRSSTRGGKRASRRQAAAAAVAPPQPAARSPRLAPARIRPWLWALAAIVVLVSIALMRMT
jgi:hypothetical protein